MLTLQKKSGKDFVVLNLTDPQLGDPEWAEDHVNHKILEYTIAQLIECTKPDLITISGDLAWAGYVHAYTMLADVLEQFQIPWAPIWGNHDNQNGAECIDKIVDMYTAYPHCIYEKGDPALGNGNYMIAIEEDGEIIEAFFMMDSHDRENYIDEEGKEASAWSRLTAAQIDWCESQTEMLKKKGCKEATLILHIPIYAYQTASRAAYKSACTLAEVTLQEAEGTDCWNEGYFDCVGVQHENISSYPYEDGVFQSIKEKGLIKYILAGHDHVNNWIIPYEGVTMIYALKTGPGCYWEPCMNGGTVLKLNKNGIYKVFHEYVDVSQFLK